MLDDMRFILALLNCARTALNMAQAHPEGFSGIHVTIDKIKEDDGRDQWRRGAFRNDPRPIVHPVPLSTRVAINGHPVLTARRQRDCRINGTVRD